MGILLALLSAPLPAEETPGSIQGKIVDGLDRRPITGARIEVVGAALSALTGDDGVFRIAGVPAGTHRLMISLAGYIPAVKTDIMVRPGRTTHVEATLEALKPDIRETVEVTASYFEKDEKNPVSKVNLSAEEIRRAPGTEGGLTRMLRVLPGVSTADDSGTYLVVRGGSPFENGYLLDDVEVPTIDHLPDLASSGGLFSALNAKLIKNVDFYTGGFSSIYGGYLSAVTDIALREGNRREFEGWLSTDLASLGLNLEGALAGGKGSWLASLRRFDLGVLKGLGLLDIRGVPTTFDIHLKTVYDFSPSQKIGLFYFHLSGRMDEAGSGKWVPERREYSQHVTGLNWLAQWNENFFSRTSLAFCSFRTVSGESFWHFYDLYRPELGGFAQNLWEVRDSAGTVSLRNSNYLVLRKSHKLEFGLQVKAESEKLAEDRYPWRYDPGRPGRLSQTEGRFRTTKTGLFVSYTGTPFERLTSTLGFRLDHSTAQGVFYFSPRFSLRYRFDSRWSLVGGAGVYYQTLPPAFLAYIPGAADLRDMKAVHYSLGMEWLWENGLKMTVALYGKEYENLPISPDQPRRLALDYAVDPSREMILSAYGFWPQGYRAPKTLTGGGLGYSRGVELFIQKKLTDKFYGFFSAAYFRCRYRDLLGGWHNRVSDNRFVANLSLGYKPSRSWEFSAKGTLLGGTPYTPFDEAASRLYGIGIDDSSRFLQSRLPAYKSLSFRVDKRFYFRGSSLVVFLDLWNALASRNVLCYWWDAWADRLETDYQMTIVPILGLEFEF